jgi:putative ABC transport system permease protein
MSRLQSWIAARWVLLIALSAAALGNLRARGMQATLSAVGLATGIGTMVLLLAIVAGLRRFAVEHIASAGGNVIQVSAQADPALRGAMSRPAALRAGDELMVLASSPHFDLASAENRVTTAVGWRERQRQNVEVRGVTATGLDILGLRPRTGRTFLEAELQYGSRVAVVGADVARQLFGAASPLGQAIQIGPWPFVVVGVLHWAGDRRRNLRSGLDEAVYVPYRTAAAAFRGDDRASHLRLRLRDPELETTAAADAVGILDRARQRRGETAGSLAIANTVEQMRVYRRSVTALQVLIVVIGGLGLFAGGVGVAHWLLMSVRERTSELALRRALGATRRLVVTSLLMDSLVLTMAGGLVGLLAAFILTRLTILLPFVPVSARPDLSWLTALLAILLLVLVGLAAGLGPAARAVRVPTAQALREG